MDYVRIGIVGIGNMGSNHVRTLMENKIQGAKLTAVCDLKPDRLNWVKETYGEDIALFDDSEKMLNSGKIDAVIIAVPHYFHPIIGISALKKGIHVLSEKPIGVYTKAAQEFIDVAASTDRVFAIMFNQRTNPVYQKMHEMIAAGELGQLKRSVWLITDWYRSQSYYNSGGWRATWAGEGGGVLINQCPHNLDLWQWICGMPSRVRAFCSFGKYHNIEVEDDVTAYVEYPNGATGLFVTTTGEAPGTNRFEVSGTMGKLVLDGRENLKFYRNKQDERTFNATYTGGFGEPEYEILDVKVEGVETAHPGIIQNFTNAILRGEKLIAPAAEGIKGLTLSNAMLLSTWTDNWIDLPINSDLFYEELQKRVAVSSYNKEKKDAVLNTEGTYGR